MVSGGGLTQHVRVMVHFAVGGRSPCTHPETVTTVTAGIERIVCETCGHVAVLLQSELEGDLDRSRFARPADDLEERSLKVH